jgi:methionine transaminase
VSFARFTSSTPSASLTRLLRALAPSELGLPPAQGTFFQLIDFGDRFPPADVAFAERLLTEGGVATIPLSPFYEKPPPLHVVRVCVAKRDPTLDAAAERINEFMR